MIKCLFLLLLLLVSSSSWADVNVGDLVPVSKWTARYQYQASPPLYDAYVYDPAAYCAEYQTHATGLTCYQTRVVSTAASQYTQSWGYTMKTTYNGSIGGETTTTATAYCDPAYYTLFLNSADNKYYCKVVSQPPADCTDKNIYNRKFYYTSSGPFTGPTHWDRCEVTAIQMLDCRKDSVGTYCWWTFRRTGGVWTGTDVHWDGGGVSAPDTTENTSDPQVKSPPIKGSNVDPQTCPNCIPCPSGTVQAGIDASGIPICIGTGTAPPDPSKTPTTTTAPPTTVTNADGSTTTTQTTTQTNADGSKTVTNTVTNTASDGTKTVTVTGSNTGTASGAPGKTDNPSADQNNLCKQNPNLSICQNSSVTGSCGTISCTGDAIQCATLRASAAMQCKQQADADALAADPQMKLGQQMASGADPQASTLPSASKASVVTMASSDTAGWLGAGSFFPDKTITLPNGQSVVLPFSQFGDKLIGLRYVSMIVAALVSFKIVRGTFASSGV